MADLATFSNRNELVAAVTGKSNSQILEEARNAGAEMILQKIFMGMMMTFDADRAAGKSAVIEYDIEGPDGRRQAYQLNVASGQCTIDPEAKGRADVKLSMTLPTFLKLSTRTANPLLLLLFGRLKVQGDRKLAREHGAWFSKRI